MHSGIAWLHARRERALGHCHAAGHFGHHGRGGHGGPGHGGHGGGGARRPLRFLVHKLELDEKQATQVAKILEDLKIERAQAEVDDRRATAAFADAIEGESFDAAAAEAAAQRRAETAARLGAAVQKALGAMHAALNGEQRETLAFLIRSGALNL